ncbi:MAG: alpha/beta hydrolase [Hamadaea sp.]|uniref:alpha/beta fold hydrolase n=1 Tax=Hamadaea sp. TaxID=2024425 RepID=UPI0017B60939|nr:alpha/beta hydrolase [Hamadaea sp.]NUR73844.1 alpha/beta hydrolase [Hamadaea sp.]NUT18991.1 alpha/beta hydrolase [Hamadaea sp.]
MHSVITSDGRMLAVEEYGVPDGVPVVYLHGTPMSRLARHPDDQMFADLGIRLITYDRPGFGRSTSAPGRIVADAADDVVTIADTLGLAGFAVFGVSGGGPHALSAAAAYPHRISRVATLASLAPCDADGLEWTAGMTAGNQESAAAARRGRGVLTEHLERAATEPLRLPERDQAVLADPAIAAMVQPAMAEALAPGVTGWVDDVLALYGLPWGFNPRTVRVPTRLWHGDLDELVPAAHSRWLADRIPDATLVIDPEAAHAGHFAATRDVLTWLRGS